MKEPDPITSTIKRIGGHLHRVVPILDDAGEVINYAVQPLMVELKPRDIAQIVIGSSILAIPVAFTGEAWELAEQLPMTNIIALAGVSLLFIACFVFFNFYRGVLKGHVFDFLKRVIATYLISAAIVALLLWIIQKAPWQTDWLLAVRRVIVVAFPACMSASLADSIK